MTVNVRSILLPLVNGVFTGRGPPLNGRDSYAGFAVLEEATAGKELTTFPDSGFGTKDTLQAGHGESNTVMRALLGGERPTP